MTARHIRVVLLWVHKGQEAAFDAFEREAARIMARHKGRIDHAVRMTAPPGSPPNDATPYEVHVVSFPDEASYEAYANDRDTVALRETRTKIIARMAIMTGREAGPY
jgi:hypothetical protein